ncbi:hypothetical protein ATCV1_z812L [Acanthocystis turfacea chlorella virus 1]|uniref:Uncharacterized protein z812L n=1 Tax=Chlorovirus heliozoae TaxID=322019 RepID=A7KA72_9PHYC|nr:hypothetical protein ATCV1_z812L [Acanthocystis turfacea chlorella virus 1]ABT16946.1 hypothetical protein ATCV1_z812L [Acanthocystis turfacea chlorella virus 1]
MAPVGHNVGGRWGKMALNWFAQNFTDIGTALAYLCLQRISILMVAAESRNAGSRRPTEFHENKGLSLRALGRCSSAFPKHAHRIHHLQT